MILENFHYSRKQLHIHYQSPHIFSSPLKPLEINHLLSVSTDLLIRKITYKWNHPICGPLLLASFTQHVFKVDPCCHIYQCFLFIDKQRFILQMCHILPTHSLVDEHWVVSTIINNAAMNIHVRISMFVFISLGYKFRSGIAKSHGNYI